MTVWFETALIGGAWQSGVRLEIGAGEERHAIGVPGLSNLHSHAFQRAMAGLAEQAGPGQDDFWTWREWMYRFLERLTPEDVEAIAALAYVEMLESGFTSVGEFHYLHHRPDGGAYDHSAEMAERIAAAAQATGIGLTLLPVFYAQSGFGGAAPTEGQKRFLTDVSGFAKLVDASRAALAHLPDGVLGIAPHSLRAVTAAQLQEIVPLAGTGPVHIHAAEQIKEVEACLAWSGERPVQWLLNHAAVGPKWCLVHATHCDADETQRLARSGAVAGLCPITEANLGDGIFPAAQFATAAGHWGVGTDSNILIGAADELRAVEYAQRLERRGRNILASAERPSVGRNLFDAARQGGNQALQRDAAADWIALDPAHPSLIGRSGDQILDAWIFAAGSNAVTCVWRGGVKCVADGRHIRRDPIAERYRGTMRRLLAGS